MELSRDQALRRVKQYYKLIGLENLSKFQLAEQEFVAGRMLTVLKEELNAPYLSDYIYYADNTPETCTDAIIQYWKDGKAPSVTAFDDEDFDDEDFDDEDFDDEDFDDEDFDDEEQ